MKARETRQMRISLRKAAALLALTFSVISAPETAYAGHLAAGCGDSIRQALLGLERGLNSEKEPAQAEHRRIAYLAGENVGKLYDASYDAVAPVFIGAVDQLLRESGVNPNPKVIFLARDGYGGFQIAKTLLASFPKRYGALTESDIKYAYLNRDTTESPLVGEYFRSLGIGRGDSVHIFDLGWYGTLENKFKRILRDLGARFDGVYMVLGVRPRNLARSYICLHDTPGPFGEIPGNPAVHFMEDTFSGMAARPKSLVRSSDGKVEPELPPGQRYEGENLKKRRTAAEALLDRARNITAEELDQLGEANTRDGLFRLLNDQSNYTELMVPHERP